MMKLNKNSGFSLAESLVSLMLLAMTVVLSLTTITRKKHHTKNNTSLSTISGMYACWYEGTIKKEFKCSGMHCEAINTDNSHTCIFKKDRRVKNYYILSVGSRYCDNSDKCTNGQVKLAEHHPVNGGSENMELKITLGEHASAGSTIRDNEISQGTTIVQENYIGGMEISKAIGNIPPTISGIANRNIETCKSIFYSPCQPAKCRVDDQGRVVMLCTDDENEEGTTYGLNSLIPFNSINGDTYFTQGVGQVKIKEKDSSLKATAQTTSESEFVKQLKMIPSKRRNGLVDKLLQYYQGNNGAKDGVAIIIW